jgi:hypothetical protein
LDRLHKRRWVRKLPPKRLTARGAQSVPFELRGDAACSAGLQIDRDHISGLILNLAGEPLARRSISVLSPSPTQALKTLGRFVKEFRGIPGVDGHLLGMGIAFCGLYDAIRDQIDHPHLLLAEGWRGLKVKEAFRSLCDPASASANYGATRSASPRGQRTTARQVFLIQTDSHAAAVGEYWERFGQAPRCLAYVYFGIGLGCGIIYRGRHFGGTDGLAGEIAHLPAILETEQRKTARLCECGRRGCLETYFFLLSLSPGFGTGRLESEGAGRLGRNDSPGEKGAVSALGESGGAQILDGFASTGSVIEPGGRVVRWPGAERFIGRPGRGVNQNTAN